MIVEVHTPCYGQDRQPLVPAAQGHTHPGLECLQAWGTHTLLGHPVPVRHHALCEKLPPCPIAMHPGEEAFPLLFIRSDQALEGEKMFSLGENSGIRG